MFHRVLLEDWHRSLPVIGFALTAAVFFSAIVRTMFTKKDRCDRLSHLPLDDDDTPRAPGPASTNASETRNTVD
jgi:hypothetical protein